MKKTAAAQNVVVLRTYLKSSGAAADPKQKNSLSAHGRQGCFCKSGAGEVPLPEFLQQGLFFIGKALVYYGVQAVFQRLADLPAR